MMEQCPEVGTSTVQFAVPAGHIYDLHNFVHVEGLKRAADVLDVVRREDVSTVLPVKAQEANVLTH